MSAPVGRHIWSLGSCETLSPVMNDGSRKGSSTDTVPADVLPSGDISPRSTTSTTIQHNLLAPMRDGTLLAMDLIRPAKPGSVPGRAGADPVRQGAVAEAVLTSSSRSAATSSRSRTPGAGSTRTASSFPIVTIAPTATTRSSGSPHRTGATATSAWLGRSYVGQTQWFAAADAPPHLKAIVPLASPPDAFFNEPILNGCFLLPMGEWMLSDGTALLAVPGRSSELFSEPQPYFDALPLSSLPEPVRDGVPLVGRDDAPPESR